MIACAGPAAIAVVRAGCAPRKSGPPERSAHRRSCSGGAVPPNPAVGRTVVRFAYEGLGGFRRAAHGCTPFPRLRATGNRQGSACLPYSTVSAPVERFRVSCRLSLPASTNSLKWRQSWERRQDGGAKSLGVQATENSENSCLPFEPAAGRAKRAWKLATEASRRQRSLCQEPAQPGHEQGWEDYSDSSGESLRLNAEWTVAKP